MLCGARWLVASLEYDTDAENYLVRFRYNGRSYKRSLHTRSEREARAVLGRIEETIHLIERGRIEMPANADPAAFILSDGKRMGEKQNGEALTLKRLFETYEAELPVGAKEESTLEGERRHFKRLLKHLRGTAVAQSLYEWRKSDKQPHFISLKSGDQMAFAGLWETWKSIKERST
jgi:SOS response associated peptidase (SRAP)